MFTNTLFNQRIPGAIMCALLLIPFTSSALASGYSGGGGGGGGGFSGGSGRISPPREVDQVYEFGKALYLGRAPGAQQIDYCVKVDGEPKKLRGRTLRSYKGASQNDFANALYNCNQPDQLALRGVEKEEIAYVLYYLNKRFKLNLQGSS